MANLYNKIYNDMKDAMKAKDQQKVLLLRGLIASVKNATINAGKEITDEAVLAAVKKNLKELDQSADSFNKAGRDYEVGKINIDRRYLMDLLPKQLDETETRLLISNVLQDLNIIYKKDMGRAIKETMARAKGTADGKLVSKLVASVLV